MALRDDVLEYLRGRSYCTLCTLGPEGPYASTVTFAEDEDLNLYFTTLRDSQKVRNLRQNPDCSLAVNDQLSPEGAAEELARIKGVQYLGRAELLEDREEVQRAMGILLGKHPYLQGLAQQVPPEQLAMVRVRPRRVVFLDYTKGFMHKEEIAL